MVKALAWATAGRKAVKGATKEFLDANGLSGVSFQIFISSGRVLPDGGQVSARSLRYGRGRYLSIEARLRMYVYFKRGDQGEGVSALHREFQRQVGRAPDWRAPTFTRAINGLTCADIDPGQREHHWWEDRLREQGWLGMELRLWELAWKAINKHGAEALLREFPETDT